MWGDIESGGFTRIDGDLHGDLTARGRVVIGENACLKSHVSGTAITIGGVVYGNIIATERLTLLSTGLIVGDVITRRIQVDDGCLVHGKVTVCKDDEKLKAALAEYHDAEGVRQALTRQKTPRTTTAVSAPAAALAPTAAPTPASASAAGPAAKKPV